MSMKLITKQIAKITPQIHETAELGSSETKITAKFFTPWSNWTWYLIELNPDTGHAFGFVDGDYPELGYFNVQDLVNLGHVERDLYWDPKTTLKELEDQLSPQTL